MMAHEEQTVMLEHNELVREDRVPLQTFRRSYAQILAGEDPWIPLGNFMHQFFGYYKHLRPELVRESIDIPEHLSPEQLRWAVFCAASVEYLCKKYDILCPQWVFNPLYSLEYPWYYALSADLPQVQAKLRQTTPEEFAKRNIFCGDRTYRNKYEHEGRQGRRRTA